MTDKAIDTLTSAERTHLDRYGFDAEAFSTLQHALSQGEFPRERNRLKGVVKAPNPEDLTRWSRQEQDRLQILGSQALQHGQVASLVLNGGMATRFGGVVKGIVEVVDAKSFLELKLDSIRSQGSQGPIFLMNSFATDEATQAHLQSRTDNVHHLTQNISVRLTPDGSIARDPDGNAAFYAPGHGDVFEVLAQNEAFQQFVQNGGRFVHLSNVDNIGATLDPWVVGAHIEAQKPVTVEVTARHAGDAGGAPAYHKDKLEIIEGFRFPENFPIESIPVFNTNTMMVNVEAIKPYPLTWFRADKIAHGSPVVQFERLMGEVTAFVDANYLEVPRDSDDSRFFPIKTPEDLAKFRDAIRARLQIN